MPFGSIEMKVLLVPEPVTIPMSRPVVIHWCANGQICLSSPASWSPFQSQGIGGKPDKKCHVDMDFWTLLKKVFQF